MTGADPVDPVDPAGPPELTVLGRIPSGSNAVYRCTDAAGDHWVYKPVLGERPLADFPDGTLAAREVATYLVSDALGWDLVPETVAAHGPGGAGMAQRWIDEADPGEDPAPVDVHPADAVPEGRAAVLRAETEDGEDVVVAHALDSRLRRMALLDVVVNNADRKGGHVLVDSGGVPWGIDHGLSFHVEPKLRTVLWGFIGRGLAEEDVPGLRALLAALDGDGPLLERLRALLAEHEIDALRQRTAALLAAGVHPAPGPGYPLPWPLF